MAGTLLLRCMSGCHLCCKSLHHVRHLILKHVLAGKCLTAAPLPICSRSQPPWSLLTALPSSFGGATRDAIDATGADAADVTAGDFWCSNGFKLRLAAQITLPRAPRLFHSLNASSLNVRASISSVSATFCRRPPLSKLPNKDFAPRTLLPRLTAHVAELPQQDATTEAVPAEGRLHEVAQLPPDERQHRAKAMALSATHKGR